MSFQNNLFQMMASDILATSPSKSDTKSSGLLLFDTFCTALFLENKDLVSVKKKYVTSFFRGKREIFSIEVLSSAIKVTINKRIGTLEDKKKLFRDVSQLGHWGNGDYQAKLENDKSFDYVISVIKLIS